MSMSWLESHYHNYKTEISEQFRFCWSYVLEYSLQLKILKVNFHRVYWNYYYNGLVRIPLCVKKTGVTHTERYFLWPLKLCVTHILHAGMTWDLNGVQCLEQICFPETITPLDSELCQMTSALGIRQSTDWDCNSQTTAIDQWMAALSRIHNVSHVASMGSLRKAFKFCGKSNLYRNSVRFT